jgi:hypothetical protein
MVMSAERSVRSPDIVYKNNGAVFAILEYKVPGAMVNQVRVRQSQDALAISQGRDCQNEALSEHL